MGKQEKFITRRNGEKMKKVLIIVGTKKKIRLNWDWLVKQPNANEIFERAKKVANGDNLTGHK